MKPTSMKLLMPILALITAIAFATHQEKVDPKYKITPHLSKEFGTDVYIPSDLNDAFKELDKMLSPQLRNEMRAKKEDGMIEYHFGLGMWMRNNWGFWKGLRLAKWFNKQGLFVPDDMSGVVLTSYWRYLHHQPINLVAQVNYYKEYWKKAAKHAADEKVREGQAQIKIKGMMHPFVIDRTPCPTVRLVTGKALDLRVRYAAPFQDGAVVTAKSFPKGPKPDWSAFSVNSYFVNLETREIHPIVEPEGPVEDSVVVDGHAYLHCRTDGVDSIIDVSGTHRTAIAVPTKEGLRLGLDTGVFGHPKLIATGTHSAFRRIGNEWKPIDIGNVTLPTCAMPAELHGNRLYMRDEGEGEDDKRLYWVDVSNPNGLNTFDKNVGVVGEGGPRWEFVWSWATATDGTLWLSTGEGRPSVLSCRDSAYSISLFDGYQSFRGEILGGESRPAQDGDPIEIDGFEPRSDGGMNAAGPEGLYEIHGNQLRTVVNLKGAVGLLTPSTVTTLKPGLVLLGGHWGQIALITNDPDGKFHAEYIERKSAEPIRL